MQRNRSKNVPLVAAMAAIGMTGKELAQKAGISRVSVSLIINQRVSPKPKTMGRIADALGVDESALFCGQGLAEGGVR